MFSDKLPLHVVGSFMGLEITDSGTGAVVGAVLLGALVDALREHALPFIKSFFTNLFGKRKRDKTKKPSSHEN